MCILSMASCGGRRNGTELILLDCDSSREVEEDAKVRLEARGIRQATFLPSASLVAGLEHLATLVDMLLVLYGDNRWSN